MKPTTLLLSTFLLAASVTAALADNPGREWMSLDLAYKHLSAAGYRDAAEMDADDGRWAARATKDGALFDVRVDPHSGAVTATPKSR